MPLNRVYSSNVWELMAEIYYVPDKESMQTHTVIIFGFSSSSTANVAIGVIGIRARGVMLEAFREMRYCGEYGASPVVPYL